MFSETSIETKDIIQYLYAVLHPLTHTPFNVLVGKV